MGLEWPYSYLGLLLAARWISEDNWAISAPISGPSSIRPTLASVHRRVTGSKRNKKASHSAQELCKSLCLWKDDWLDCHKPIKTQTWRKKQPRKGRATKSHCKVMGIGRQKLLAIFTIYHMPFDPNPFSFQSTLYSILEITDLILSSFPPWLHQVSSGSIQESVKDRVIDSRLQLVYHQARTLHVHSY